MTVSTALQRRPVIAILLSIGLAAGLLIAPAIAPSADAAPNLSVVDSPVSEVFDAAVGADGSTYAVGDFTQAGPATGGIARLNTANADVDRTFPTVNGYIYSMITDSSGRIYIGGTFVAVAGQPRLNIARLNADGSLDATWAPEVSTLSPGGQSAVVKAMAIHDDTLFVGGFFTSVAGTSMQHLAAISTVTGDLVAWTPNPSSQVNALAVDDTHLYVGGSFTSISATSQPRLAAINLGDLSLDTGWNPTGADQAVGALATHNGMVYVGGYFTTIATVSRNWLAALDANTGVATSWDPDVRNSNVFMGGSIESITFDDSLAYIGGNFDRVNTTQIRNKVAALRTDDTGTVTNWDANIGPAGLVKSVLITGTDVYLGGTFESVGGTFWRRLARVDKSSGAHDNTWDPRIPAGSAPSIQGLLTDGSSIIAAGTFSHVNVVTRNGAAAFDSSSMLTGWDPNLPGATVYGIAVSGTTAYLVGDFSSVNGSVTRNYAAAFRTDDTGTVTAWDPNLDSYPYDIVIEANLAYLVGDFGSVGGVTRNYAAAINIGNTATLTSWDPDLDSAAFRIALDGDVAYMVGDFSTVNGGTVMRDYAAGVRLDDTGTATEWNPRLDSNAYEVAVHEGLVYLGGGFQQVNLDAGGVFRNNLASFNTDDTGSVTDWDPYPNGEPRDIQVSGSYAYIGGDFTTLQNGSVTRQGLAAVSIDDTGSVSDDWVPLASGGFTYGGPPGEGRLNIVGNSILVGGSFPMATLNGINYPGGLAVLPIMGSAPTPTPTPVTPTAPGAPLSVIAEPGDQRIAVSWSAPTNTGSFAITNYRVSASPGNQACITQNTSCAVTGLQNGQEYSITVTALSGAGWGTSSTAVTATPLATGSLVITGTRDGRFVKVVGTASGLIERDVLVPWVRRAGSPDYIRGSARIQPDPTGEFTWQRRAAKRVDIMVATLDERVRSNVVRIPARR